MAEIKTIFGGSLSEAGASEDVVQALRGLLEEAERGEIKCFAIAFLDGANLSITQVTGSNGMAAPLGGAISMLHHRYFSSWKDQADGSP